MKISKLFHTLYAFLMFLPVMVLPLFAININQKEVEPLTAQIEEIQVVDFNQIVINGLPNQNLDYWAVDASSSSFVYENGYIKLDMPTYLGGIHTSIGTNLIEDNIYILSWYGFSNKSNLSMSLYFNGYNLSQYSNIDTTPKLYQLYYTNTRYFNGNLYISFGAYDTDVILYVKDFQIFNLTQMFGSGNEPTIQQFNTWYPNDYYRYTTGRKDILHLGTFYTLNNTDIGSQFLYSLYNPLKDYFNLPNYMNLGGLYDWFLVNLFSGYYSPVYFIIFTLMLYWLALSLLWLIFDVLMYVPSMIHKLLDKARME